MSKRKAEDDNESDSWVKNKFSKGTNSLDSDEDEEDDDNNKNEENYFLSKNDIIGQEDTGIINDGEVQITPFNIEEEMEEGHFDSDGMYHWNKEKLIKDNWLDNIDWMKIKPKGKGENETNDDSGSESDLFFDEIPLYKQLLDLIETGETVSAALRRHGGTKSLSALERLKRKKAGLPVDKNDGNVEIVTKLTEIANMILSRTGNMDIYQQSYEQIAELINKLERKKQSTNINSSSKDDLDMYADDFDEKEKAKLDTGVNTASVSNDESDTKTAGVKEHQWEYKLNLDDEDVKGPFSTDQMMKWKAEKHFENRILVRKAGSEGTFYSEDRVDYELYI